MPVTIYIPTALKQFAGDQSEVQVEAKTVGEALAQLTSEHAELRRHLYNQQNALRNFVNVYVNDEDIRHHERLETPLKDGDAVTIVPSIAGGMATTEAEVTQKHLSRSRRSRTKRSRATAATCSCPKSGWRGSGN